jgi:4-hydroxy-4-methyl-2-oxoglutarate aldolase
MPDDNPMDLDLLRRTLYAAVISDVLDAIGLRDQVVSVALRCVSGQVVLVGRAKTTRWEEIEHVDPNPYELELKAVDQCAPGDVFVAAAAGSPRSGVWGELLSTAARNQGCVGALVDGAVRDVVKMSEMNFTVFARSVCPRDSRDRQRVTGVDVPVDIGGVRISPGDLLFADADGVVVVPRAAESEVLEKALEKVTAENRVRDEIRAGTKAADVFRKYGVL